MKSGTISDVETEKSLDNLLFMPCTTKHLNNHKPSTNKRQTVKQKVLFLKECSADSHTQKTASGREQQEILSHRDTRTQQEHMNAEKSALIELKFMHATLFTVQIIIKQQKREQIKLVTELSLVKLTSHTTSP